MHQSERRGAFDVTTQKRILLECRLAHRFESYSNCIARSPKGRNKKPCKSLAVLKRMKTNIVLIMIDGRMGGASCSDGDSNKFGAAHCCNWHLASSNRIKISNVTFAKLLR